MGRGGVKKSDLYFLAVVAALVVGVLIFFYLVSSNEGHEVIIEEANNLVGVYPLGEDRTIEVEGILGTTTVVIENGEVYVSDSPCPNKVCIRMGRKGEVGDTIVCLPNRIYISIR